MSKEKDLPIGKVLRLSDSYLQSPPKLKSQAKSLHKLRQTARQIVSLLPEDGYSQQRVKRVIQASNKIRDLDVLLLELLPGFPEEYAEIVAEIKEQLLDVRWRLDDDFKNDLQMEMVPEIESCIGDDQVMSHMFAPTAGEALHDRLKDIKARFKKIKKQLGLLDNDSGQIHKQRLKVKRIRYQVEHYFPEQQSLLDQLKYLQKQLGEFHDYAQAEKMIGKYTELDATQRGVVKAYLLSQQQQILSKVRKKLNRL
ncbi:CHAD domain-containing protein [Thiomicrorhabdus sp. 6S2-11]|uniref:CHAD domain-containing protein n=1 Tax=Thiomicrorhabdus marina TaxID=2818442 RepID=A0ABS3Q219_9GAMM|nr:CHAD domain-containing protein [Thiomicrorhabdus marina]MBO1926375.1 CHAD domain-containing protein [Thiomicrorhabdus marina]